MYVSTARLPPLSPSASAHSVPVSVVPGELCASYHVVHVGPGHHIARSTITGCVEVTTVDTGVSASFASAPFTYTVCRLFPATVSVLVTVVPSGSRYVIVTVAAPAFGFAIKMYMSKNDPVDPNA